MRATKMIAKLLNHDPNAEEDRLRRRHQELTDHLAKAVAAAERAAEQRRALLIEADAIDEASLAKAEAVCREADDRRQAIEAAAREVAQRVAEAEASRLAASDRAERERVAAELIARAGRLEKAAANLDRAAEKFAEARESVLSVFAKDAPDGFSEIGLSTMPGAAVAHHAGYVAGILTHSGTDKMTGVPESAIGAAIAYMDSLKRTAAAVLDGSAPAVLPGAREPYIKVVIPDEPIVLSRPVTYHGHLNSLQHVTAGGVTLPAPVAEAARQAGIGFAFESAEGKAILRVAGHYPSGSAFKPHTKGDGTWTLDQGDPHEKTGKPVPREPYQHLDISLYDYEIAERARLRAAA